MKEITTHEQCSELLAPFAKGELDDATERAVDVHLQGCSDCASEHRAVLALLSAEPQPLTDIERARMRRVVLEEAVPAPDTHAIAPAPADRRARLFPLLGAAALIAIIAVFAFTGLGNLGGTDAGDSTAQSGGEGEADEAEGEDTVDGGLEAAQEEQASEDTAGGSAAGAGTMRAKAPTPTFRPSIGEVDRARLNKLGRQGLPLVVFSRAFSVTDVPRLRDRFIEHMADRAPTAHGNQIRDCATTITEEFPNALPAYSAIGHFAERPQREVLIVAFAWTDEPEGPLDQSMVWAWPLGNCGSVAHYSKNVIEPRR